MNQNLTDVTVILDRSGSMSNLVDATIEGYNQLKAEQVDGEGECTWTEVQFSSTNIYNADTAATPWAITVQNQSVESVRDLSNENYHVGGMTALLDTIGAVIRSTGERLASLAEDDRPGTVIIVITTDGHENASVEYTRAQINEMITHQQTKYDWQFIFMAANQDAIATGADLGLAAGSTLSYAATKGGAEAAFKGLSGKLGMAREYSSKGASRSLVQDALTFNTADREAQYAEGANDQLNTDDSGRA